MLYDRAILGYASRLELETTAVPEIREGLHSTASFVPSLPMGWALKCARGRNTRFSTKQKDYLNAKFQIGERSWQKADPTSVSKAMRTAKVANGTRLFDNSDFLTAQQIASFFSRLAAKRSTEDDNQVETEDEQNPVQQESQLQQIKENVVASISIQHAHPIVYDAHNICDLL